MTAEAKHYDVLRKPVTTEKSVSLSVNNGLVFEVAMDASKPLIRESVEKVFGVKVKTVNTLVRKGQMRRFRRHQGRMRDRKLAFVILAEGHAIDFSAGL